jgi:hypothetical protein
VTSPRYRRAHQGERERWRLEVEAGLVCCAYCGAPIAAGEPWDLGHIDGGGPLDWAGPEHRRCNRDVWARRRSSRPALEVVRPGPSRVW